MSEPDLSDALAELFNGELSTLNNDAERKRLFEQLFIAGMASGKSIDQLTLECGIIVDRLCPKRTYKPTPTPGPGRVIKNTGTGEDRLSRCDFALYICLYVIFGGVFAALMAYVMGVITFRLRHL